MGFQPDRVQSFIKPEPYHSMFNSSLLGRDCEVGVLFELAQKTHESRLISVWGMPGVGKSALVEALYDKLRTSNKFNRHVWVSVSNPFNPTEFCRSLLANLHREATSSGGEYEKAFRAEDPIQECRDHLRECVCLFVIECLQSNEDWDWIKSNLIEYGGSRSCIIIITSEENVAKHCATFIDGVYNVKGLHATAATELFEKVLGETVDYQIKWMERGYKTSEGRAADLILSKCGGLPRVITTVAGYLARKPRDILEREMRRLCDNFLEEVMSNPEFESLRDIPAWLHSYMDACPRHLKKYMLYQSIFPQDIIIRQRRLIRRWIAEGYSKGNDSISMEKYAEKMFNQVAALVIMQPVLLEASNETGYRVNGFFRECIMARPVEETIFFPVEVSALEKQGHGRLATDGIGQHLAIGRTWEIDQTMFESLDLSRVRSLTVFRVFWTFYVSDRMRVLRVLDLENSTYVGDSDFQKIGKLPSRLKFLSLRGQWHITCLPDSVGDLLQLENLDIRDTRIATLPAFITGLRKLQYIRAGTSVAWTDEDINSSSHDAVEGSSSRSRTLASCLPKKFLSRGGSVVASRIRGVEVPRGIKRLEALHTLGAVHVNTPHGKAIFEEIVDSLPQLKKLHVSGISRNHGLALRGLIWKAHLESLSLQFKWPLAYYFLIPRSLRSLKMTGHVELLPDKIEDAGNLVKLTLEMTHALFTAQVIQEHERLPNLRTLRLCVSKEDEQVGELRFPTAVFSKLQVLEIACRSKLHVRFDEGAMEKLEQLKFHCLEGSEMDLSGLEHPVSLKQVWLLGCFNNQLVEAVQEQLAKHPKIPGPKLKVLPRPERS